MRTLYTLSVRFYALLIQIAAIFNNTKAKQWIKGRKKWEQSFSKKLKSELPVIWFHAASLGEFEQARPLIEKIKKEKPNYYIVLTFFSPSGYEIRKDYSYADHICYLPLDTPLNAKKFIDLINPELVVMVKYEFWFNYLKELQKRHLKTILISGIFRPSQLFFKSYGSWFRKQLKVFDTFFLQNENSEKLLNEIGYQNTLVTGDTRFDRVHELAQESFENKAIEKFCNNQETLVFGSSWEKENDFAKQLIKDEPDVKIIIAPHEIENVKMQSLKSSFGGQALLWSELNKSSPLSSTKVLIVDQIGMLSKIYRYATIAIIGGGFSAGIHNVLEAAVYGCPCLFGPNHEKFQEAKDLLEKKGAFSIEDYRSFKHQIQKLLSDKILYQNTSVAAKEYVERNAGASQVIYKLLFNNKSV